MRNAPSTVCHVCLRNDKKVSRLGFELESYYADLCDYIELLPLVQFCGECTKRLKNSYEFKNICMTAARKLKKWRKQKPSERLHLNLLYRELPSYPHLSLSNKKNFKVHFCQSSDLESSSSFEVSSSKHPNIVTVNIPQAGKTEITYELTVSEEPTTDVLNTENIKKEEVDFVAFDDSKHILEDDTDVTQDKDIFESNSESLNSDDDITDSSDSEYIDIPRKGKEKDITDSDSDESVENFIDKYITPLNKKLEDPKNKHILEKLQNNKKYVNIELLAKKMRERFEKCKPVIDSKGNEIDVDIVVGCFDKLTQAALFKVRKHCIAKGPFTPKAIKLLSELRDNYAGYDDMDYTIHYMRDDEEMRVEFEKRREAPQYTECTLRCESCIIGFKYEGLLRDHMKTIHDASNDFECSLCKKRCKTKYLLGGHMRGHRRLYKCKRCPFVTSHKSSVIKHCNHHAGVKYACKECGKEYTSPSVLSAHGRCHKPKHPCPLCGGPFNCAIGLALHKRRKHQGEQFVEGPANVRCESCNATFISEQVYQNHMKISHGPKGSGLRVAVTPTCTLCGESGKGNIWLTRHMRTVHPEVPTPIRTHKHLCETCGKGFFNVFTYKDHLNTHTGARPYKCPHCPKTFQRIQNLYIHRQRHLPPSHVCNYCGKKFTAASNLSNHIRIHVGIRRFKCEICGKGFLHNWSLRDHVNGVHYNIRKKRNRKISQS